MRIVGGTWRGRQLKAPEGRGTRPTTDRVRESLASMVLSAFDLSLEGVRVLDAFAGSGALGLEMLSRGALSCTFVERDRRAAGVVRSNCQALGAGAAAQLRVGDVCALAEAGSVPGGPFDLVLLDPPYALEVETVARLVTSLDQAGQLTRDAVVLYERASERDELALEDWEILRTKARGTTTVTLFAREKTAADETSAAAE